MTLPTTSTGWVLIKMMGLFPLLFFSKKHHTTPCPPFKQMTSNLTCRISIKSGLPDRFTIFPNHRDDDFTSNRGKVKTHGGSRKEIPIESFQEAPRWMDGWISLMACQQAKTKRTLAFCSSLAHRYHALHVYIYIYVHVMTYIYILPLFPRENDMPTLGLAAYANHPSTPILRSRPAIASTCQRTSRPTSNAVGITYQRPCRSALVVGCGWGWGGWVVGWLGVEERGWGQTKLTDFWGGIMMELRVAS